MQALDELRAIVADPPNVWGEGSLFAFSGLDGATCSASSFVGSFWSPRYDILFRVQRPRRLRLSVREPSETLVATGDVLAVRTPEGPLLVTWAAWHTLVGLTPSGVVPELLGDSGGPDGQELALVMAPDGRFALGFGNSAELAAARARAGLAEDAWDVASDRLHALRELRARADAFRLDLHGGGGTPLDAGDSRLLNKCLSVMRVNTLAAEGVIRQTWSTPDRVPHRHMWLWDSVFHTMAMSLVDPDTAWRFLKSVLDFAAPNGLIPITMCVDGAKTAGGRTSTSPSHRGCAGTGRRGKPMRWSGVPSRFRGSITRLTGSYLSTTTRPTNGRPPSAIGRAREPAPTCRAPAGMTSATTTGRLPSPRPTFSEATACGACRRARTPGPRSARVRGSARTGR